MTDPVTGNNAWSTGYQYDASGNLTQKTDARGVLSTYAYDAVNRNTTINYSDTSSINPDVSHFYDGATNGKGRLWYSYAGGTESTGSNVEKTSFDSYDAAGRPLVLRQVFKLNGVWSPAYQISRAYNRAGGVTSQIYPSGRSVAYSYDTAGRTTGFTGSLGDGTVRSYASNVTYSPFGGLTREQFGTNIPLYQKSFYNIRGQLFDTRLSSVNDTWDWNRSRLILYYSSNHLWGQSGTDNNGNVRFAETWIPPENATLDQADVLMEDSYTYDSLNRLVSVSEQAMSASGGWIWQQQFQQTYSYDRYGNRTINAAQTSGTGINNKQFTVDANTNRLGVPAGQPGAMSYDFAGNLTTDTYSGFGNRTYDGENKMTAAQDTSGGWSYYTYNADGQRTRRKISNQETWQIYGFDGELIAEYAASGAVGTPQKEYGYRNGQLLVRASVTGTDHSLSLNGTSAYVQGPSSSSLSITGAITVEAWIKIDSIGAYRAIISKEAFQQTGTGGGYRLAITDLGKVRLDLFQTHSTYTTAIGTTTVTPGVWQHVAGVFDGSQMRIYLNGVLNGTVSTTNGPATGTGNFYLGRFSSSSTPYYFNGLIDDARVSNAALYTSNFTPANSLTASGSTKGLWKFNGQTTNDSSGNGNNGTLQGGAAYSGNVPGGGGSSLQLQWLVSDHLGTPRMIVDQTGSLANMKRHDYLPFGEELVAPTGGRSTAQGYASGDGVRQQFTSKERDNETGLDYFLARYYSSTQGRFTSADPSNPGGLADDPQSWHGYAYARNNPLKYQDPDGKSFKICDPQGNCSIVFDDDAKQYTFNREYQKKNGYYTRGDGKIYGADGSVIGTYQNLGCDCWSDTQNRMISGIADELGKPTTYLFGAAAAIARTRLGPIKPVNLPASRNVLVDMVEVASGHMHGGERAVASAAAGKGKSLFAQWMTPTQVESAIIDAYEHSEITRVQGVRVVLQGVTKDGSRIEMWFNRETKVIETAYPIAKK